jgi:fumarylacetoacetate (FAA) hydrolase
MKLASLPQGRDGRLIVVSDDLAWYADADHIVPTMQRLLDEWHRHADLLESLAVELAHGAIPRKRFHEREAAAPLPRTFHWTDAADAVRNQPGDGLMGARDPLRRPGASEVGLVAMTADVPQGATPDEALGRVRLIGLAHAVAAQSAPGATGHFSPVFVTPAALGGAWADGALAVPVTVTRGSATSTVTLPATLADTLAGLVAERALAAGTLVSLSAPLPGDALGSGDTLRIEARHGGKSLFGAIEQVVHVPA